MQYGYIYILYRKENRKWHLLKSISTQLKDARARVIRYS